MSMAWYSLLALPHHIAQGEEVKDITASMLKLPWHRTAMHAHHDGSTGAESSITATTYYIHHVKISPLK